MEHVTICGKPTWMDGLLYENLEILKKAVEKKWDGVFYTSGYEGDGKTTITSQVLGYLDQDMNLDNVVFTPKQFLEACTSQSKKTAVLFDESYLTFNNKSADRQVVNAVISMLTMIRKKQLFIGIVAPTFFDINKYIAIHRSRFMLYAWAEGLERGYFKFYNREKKHELYIKGKKEENMRCVRPNFSGKYPNMFPFDEEAYEKKKDISIRSLKDELRRDRAEIEQIMYLKVKDVAQAEMLGWLKQRNLLKPGALKRFAQSSNLTPQAISLRLARYSNNTENEKNEGLNWEMSDVFPEENPKNDENGGNLSVILGKTSNKTTLRGLSCGESEKIAVPEEPREL